jgi:cysteine desulfuration protein SufE
VTPLEAKLADLTATFADLTDPQERMSFAADWGRRIKPVSPAERIDANRVPACISPVWLVGEVREGQCFFRAEAESPVVKGLLALLCELYSGVNPQEIAASNLDPLDALGLLRNLSPTRRNGLAGARSLIQGFAKNHSAQAANS